MRKTALKNRSRRKTSSTSNTSNPPTPTNIASLASPEPQAGAATAITNNNNTGSERRKPTSEEAGLTAKNYRLAKELSELRVRHRDETKNVTRLSMENMNLASRCREAINHVAMLKKELVFHQRRNAELMAIQKQGSKRRASTDMSSANNTETSPGDELDKLIVEQASTSMPSIPKDPTLAQDQDQASEQQRAADLDPTATQKADRRKIQSIGNNRRDTRSKINPTHHSPPSKLRQKKENFEPKPESISTKKDNQSHKSFLPTETKAKELQLESSIMTPSEAFGELHTSDFFQQQSYKLSLESTPERDDADDNRGSSDIKDFTPFSGSKTFDDELLDNRHNNSSSATSGIDAFDASFSTTFPTSFPVQTTKLSPTVDRAFNIPEFSDSFFLSSSNSQTPVARDKNKNDFANTRTKQLSNGDNDQSSNKAHSHDASRTTGFSDDKTANKTLFPSNAFSSFETFSTNNSVQLTPVSKAVSSDDNSHKSKTSERKTFPNEKVKDSQTNTNSTKTDNRSIEEHSPTLVLRRLQQRRAKERANNSASASKQGTDVDSSRDKKDNKEDGNGMQQDDEYSSRRDLNSRFATSRQSSGRGKVANGNMKTLSAEYMSDEIRHLDAIANGSSPAQVTSSMPTRRNAKQPISYAEPPINSKLRRGDVFFQRKDPMNSEEKENPEGKESLDTDYNMYGKGRKSKGVDDVLKDLVSTTVP